MYVPKIWIHFEDGAGIRWCELDGLLIDIRRGVLTVVEIKLKHCERAWWQLFNLYAPLIQKIMGDDWSVRTLELVRWYDPATQVPQSPRLIEDIERVPAGEFAVHIWRP